MPSFLPPVLMELRAEGTQAIAEMKRVGESAREMADKAVAASQREVAAAKEAATEAKAAADQKVAAADAAAKAQQVAAERTAAAVKAAAEQEQASIQAINKAMAEGSITAQEAAQEQAAAAERAAAAITAAEKEEAAAVKATATAQKEAAAAVQASSDAEIRSFAAQGAASDAMAAKHKANGKSIVEASNVISGAAVVAAGIIGVAAVEEASKFQKSTELLVTAGGESQAQLGAVRTGIMGIAADTGTATDQLSEGMYVMEKAGYHGADGLKVLRAAAEGAKAENVDLATMTQAVTDVLLDYGKGADQAVSVTNGLVAASGLAKTTMQDFAASMAAIVPTASVAHLSFAQVGGALATMTQHGESAQQSSQNLANLLTQLERPSNIASKAMQQMGIDVTDLSKNIGDENGGRGLLGTLQLMDQHIKDHMGPDGLIVQDAMNKSKSAADDLQKIIAQMPPDLAKLSSGFMDGTVSQAAYQKGFKGMGGSAAALGNQFLGLAKSSMGVNDLLKSGNPALMTYVGMWNRAAGGITGARTAMMLLMNNSTEFENNIKRITDAEDQNGQHISTWAQTQNTFAVQLDMTKQAAGNLGIELGTRLLPVAQQLMGGVTDLIHGFEKGNPVLLAAAGIVGGAMLISVTNLGIKMGKTAVSVVQDAMSLGKAITNMASEVHMGFSTAGTAAEVNSTRMAKFGGAIKGALPVLGGLGAAATGAVIGLQILDSMSQEVTIDTEKMKKALVDFSDAGSKVGQMELDQQFSQWRTSAGMTTVNVQSLDQAVSQLTHVDGYGQFSNFFDGLRGSVGATKSDIGQLQDRFKSVGDQLGQMVQGGSVDVAAKAFDNLAGKFVQNGKSAQDALDTMPGYTQALKDQAAAVGVQLSDQELLEYAMGKVPQKMLDAMGATQKYTDAAGNVKPITPQLQKSLDDAGVSADGLVTDLDKVRQGMEAAGLATVNQRDAQAAMNKAMDDAKAYMDQFVADGHKVGEGLNKNATDFDLTTDAGRNLNDQFENVMRKGLDFANSIQGTGVDAQKQVQDALGQTYKNLVDSAHQMGITGGKADDLARQVMQIPPGVDINTWMSDYAKQKAGETTAAVNSIPGQGDNPVVVHVAVSYDANQIAAVKAQIADLQAHAQDASAQIAQVNSMNQANQYASGNAYSTPGHKDGGLIRHFAVGGFNGPVFGPGTGTSDSIPAMLSNGEYVVKASSVARVGVPYLDQINAGQVPRVNAPAMAGGPSVVVNAVTNASPHQIASEVGWALRNQN
ncbi:MAG: phage tail tape measure protein [Marmoricola sp.]